MKKLVRSIYWKISLRYWKISLIRQKIGLTEVTDASRFVVLILEVIRASGVKAGCQTGV